MSGVEQGKTVCVCLLYDCPTTSNYVDEQHDERQHQKNVDKPADRIATHYTQ
jgi:hypothetical protein